MLLELISCFYAVENARGIQAWENTAATLEARGEMLDWEKLIPRPVPDEQNMLKAPRMADWHKQNQISSGDSFATLDKDLKAFNTARRYPLGNVSFVSETTSDPNPNLLAWPQGLDALSVHDNSVPLLPEVIAVNFQPSMGWTFTHLSTHSAGQLPRVDLTFQASHPPTANELENALQKAAGPYVIRVDTTTDPNRFELLLVFSHAISADDFLKATEVFQPDFEVIRSAARRPLAQEARDYSKHFHPQTFSSVRSLTRCAEGRAKAHLLIGKPAEAKNDLNLIHAGRKTLTDQEMYLVPAMIDTVMAGLALNVVLDGLTLHQWREPELVYLQSEAAHERLFHKLFTALRGERNEIIHAFKTHTWSELLVVENELVKSENEAMGIAEPLTSQLWRMAPSGWKWQNLRCHVTTLQQTLDCFDRTTGVLDIRAVEMLETMGKNEPLANYPFHHLSHSILVLKADVLNSLLRQSARRQTQADLVVLGCALERSHLANGAYPATLAALDPKFLSQAPRQLVNGQPFCYRLESDGGYSLWSVGWDLKDGGGIFLPGTPIHEDQPDWGYRLPARPKLSPK